MGPRACAQCKQGGTSMCLTLRVGLATMQHWGRASDTGSCASACMMLGVALVHMGECTHMCAHWPTIYTAQWPRGHGSVMGCSPQIGNPWSTEPISWCFTSNWSQYLQRSVRTIFATVFYSTMSWLLIGLQPSWFLIGAGWWGLVSDWFHQPAPTTYLLIMKPIWAILASQERDPQFFLSVSF